MTYTRVVLARGWKRQTFYKFDLAQVCFGNQCAIILFLESPTKGGDCAVAIAGEQATMISRREHQYSVLTFHCRKPREKNDVKFF